MVERQQFVVAVLVGLLGDHFLAQFVVLLDARSASWLFACSVSPNQLNRSRTGFSALFAPSWIGETTVRKPRCTECRPPSGGLAEVGGQQYQGEHDEQRKHRTSTPDRLVVHE